MILKALYDYYNRSIDSDPNSLPKYGTMNVKISFIVIIDHQGTYLGLKDYHQEPKQYVLPKGVHTNASTPFLFWDNCQYVLNYSTANKPLNANKSRNPKEVEKWEKALENAQNKHKSFVKKCADIANETQDIKFLAVSRFYSNNELAKLMASVEWETITANPSANVSFQIIGDTQLVASSPLLMKYIDSDSTENGICLLTGNKGRIVRKTTPTPIPGCQSSACLVSFQKNSGYDSYGKIQAYNAPISEEAEFAFSTALKKLIEPDSKNRFFVNDRLYVFFASRRDESSQQMENCIFSIFGKSDDPNANIDTVRKTIHSIYSGNNSKSTEHYFYILGIAPNIGREAVIYYSETQLAEFAEFLDRHFVDMEISAPKWKYPYFGLYDIVRSVSRNGDSDNCPPNLPDNVVKSIFQGLPYPYTLFCSAINRIRAERDVAPNGNPGRVAILKAYLNRLNNDNKKKITVMLDKENTNQGYLCGRLFAVLDKIQEDANNIHGIQERYMNSASTTPAAVFATILNLSSHHSEKLNEGSKVFYEKLKQEIIDKLSADGFPAHLDLQDQGRFFVGFYHQRQAFFTKKAETSIE